jgi:zinc/manganese transport system permease protein
VQLVGVYLVFTSLIVPALAIVSYVVGLVLSAVTDLPTSALVVPVMVVIGIVVHLESPRNGANSLTQLGGRTPETAVEG